MTAGELMFFGGIGLCAAAIIAFVIIKLVLYQKGKRLKSELAQKYDI